MYIAVGQYIKLQTIFVFHAVIDIEKYQEQCLKYI